MLNRQSAAWGWCVRSEGVVTDNVSQLPLDEPAQPLARTIWLLWLAAALFVGASLLPDDGLRLGLTVSGLSLVVLVGALAALDFTQEELERIDAHSGGADVNLWAASAERKGPSR